MEEEKGVCFLSAELLSKVSFRSTPLTTINMQLGSSMKIINNNNKKILD